MKVIVKMNAYTKKNLSPSERIERVISNWYHRKELNFELKRTLGYVILDTFTCSDS
jgi:hypothetical protein